MKSKKNIKSIMILAVLSIASLFFINMSLATSNAKVNVETANLRETADSNSKILEQLSINDSVEIIEESGEWYKVKAKDITGYLRKDLLTVEKETVSEEIETNTATTDNTVEADKEETAVIKNTNNDEIEIGKQKVTEDTKLKIVPVINATDIIEVKKDEEVNVIEIINGWACIEKDTTKGWIRVEKLQKDVEEQENAEDLEETEDSEKEQETKTKYISSETVNLRKEANTDSAIVEKLTLNTPVEVISEENGWSKVKVNGKEGYISTSLLSDKKQETSRSLETPRNVTEEANKATSKSASTATASTSGNGSSIVATAKQYIGSSYVYGGSSPSGFDCSGFTSYIYKQYGVNLSRTAAGQYSNGTAVSRENLQAGDLVMFGGSGINHVGIYIGGGQIVHAANPSRGVTTDTINSGYYNNNYVGARRVIQ